MPFNQQMGIACELTLVTTDRGIAMRATPVRELLGLRQAPSEAGELLDVVATLHLPCGERGGLEVRGVPVVWDRSESTLAVADLVAPLPETGDTLDLRILVDRGSLEAFAAGGLVAMAKGIHPAADDFTVRTLGATSAAEVAVHPLRSIWNA